MHVNIHVPSKNQLPDDINEQRYDDFFEVLVRHAIEWTNPGQKTSKIFYGDDVLFGRKLTQKRRS